MNTFFFTSSSLAFSRLAFVLDLANEIQRIFHKQIIRNLMKFLLTCLFQFSVHILLSNKSFINFVLVASSSSSILSVRLCFTNSGLSPNSPNPYSLPLYLPSISDSLMQTVIKYLSVSLGSTSCKNVWRYSETVTPGGEDTCYWGSTKKGTIVVILQESQRLLGYHHTSW